VDNLFKEKSEYIRIFLGTEIETDPYEHTVEETLLNSIPIKAIVSDISPASSQWKMPGIVSEKTKQIIIKKKHEDMLKMSRKIKIGDDYYYGWKVNGRLNYVIEGEYLKAYVYIKKES